MSINFGQFPVATLPIAPTDAVVGYQSIGGVPTLAQYTMTQLFRGVFPTGTVPVSQGGTGLSALPAGDLLVGTGTNTMNFIIPGAAGQVLISQGTSVSPQFGNNPILGAGATAVTGNGIENSTQVATDQFVNQQIIRFSANVPLSVTGGVINQAVTGTGVSFVIFVSGGVISSVVSVISGGTGYAVGDMMLVQGGNFDARVRITNVVGGVVQSGGISVLYGGTGYTTGATVQAMDVPPGQRTITLTGILTSNITYILQSGTFLNASRRPEFVNNTTGAFTVTVKISNGAGGSTGTGVVLPQGTNNSTALTLLTDGVTDVWIADTPLGIGAFPLLGTTTNNNAAAGTIGEFVTANANGVALTTGVAVNITSISLTAGDWDVSGTGGVVPAGTTTVQQLNFGITTATGTLPGSLSGQQVSTGPNAAAGFVLVHGAPVVRFSLAATTTIFLVMSASFLISTCTGQGVLRARRVR